MKRKELFMPMELQFFAEGGTGADGGTGTGEGSGSEGSEGTGTSGSEGGTGEGDQTKSGSEKTFSQAELNTVATREKAQGKNSVYKLFGVDEKTAKAEAEEYKKWKESQMTAAERATAKEKELSEQNSEAEKRATAAENKLACVMAGVTKDSVEDALAIATLKVTEDKPLDKVLEEMKKEARYKGFFEESGSNSTGTGKPMGSKGGTSATTGVAARLAEANKASATQKSSYFKHN